MSLTKKLLILFSLLFLVTFVGLCIFVFTSGNVSSLMGKALSAYFQMRHNDDNEKNKTIVIDATKQLEKNPDNKEALKQRVDAYFELGEDADCRNDCDRLIALEPNNVDWYKKKAQAFIESREGENKEVIKTLTLLIEKQKPVQDDWAFIERARYYLYEGEKTACLQDLAATTKVTGDADLSAYLLKSRADIYIDAKEFEKGKKDLERLIQSRSFDQYERLPALEKLCAVLIFQDNIKSALQHRLDFLKIEEENKDERSLPNEFYFDIANLCTACGEEAEAQRNYLKCQGKIDTSLDGLSRSLETKDLLAEGGENKDDDSSIDMLCFLIHDVDANWDNEALARILKHLSPKAKARFIKEALPTYQAILKERTEAPCALSILYTAEGQKEKALEYIKKSNYCNIAIITKLESEDFTDSLALAENLSDDMSGNSCRGLILINKNQTASAQKLFDESKSEFTDDPAAIYRMSRLARLLAHKAESKTFLLQAAALGNFEALKEVKSIH